MILLRQHGESGPPGLLKEWLDARGLAYEISDSRGDALPDPREYTAVASLGCRYCPADTDVPQVAGELRLIEQAVDARRPGARPVLRRAGAREGARRRHRARADARARLARDRDRRAGARARGPVAAVALRALHHPPGAREIARTKDAIQAFRYGRHLGVQFHPESTVDIVAGWARKDAERLNALGIEDVRGADRGAGGAQGGGRHAAFRLFDAFRGGESS